MNTVTQYNVPVIIRDLQMELQNGLITPHKLSHYIEVVYQSGKWRQAKVYDDKPPRVYEDFKAFVEDDRPWGLGTPYDKLKAWLKGTQAERIFPMEVPTPNPHGGDRRSEEYQHGNTILKHNTTDHKLGRLKRDRPELAQQVIDGQLSANAAYIQAGFAPKKKSVPIIADKVIEFIHREFTAADIAYIRDNLL